MREWILELRQVVNLDLACAYAIRRATAEAPAGAVVRIRGANRGAHKALHDAGADVVAIFES